MSSVVNGKIEHVRAPGTPQWMSYEEFLEWPFEDPHVEWVDGKVVAVAPINDEHADVAGFVYTLLRVWAQDRGLGVVRAEPFQMKTGPKLPGRAPDVLFVAKENRSRLKRVYVDGPADLAVEVISPDSRSRDRDEKFFEYQQGGVKEYWLIDPELKQADFYQLGGDGVYHAVTSGDAGIYQSAVLAGLWLKVEWLWQRPLPTVLSVLREWKLI